jgi:hypothetical protein
MLADVLRNGFAAAQQRSGLIFFDILWKVIWIGLTVTGLCGAVLWITYDLNSIEWTDTGNPTVNGLLAATLLRDFWMANQWAIVATVLMVLLSSAVVWIFLEAFFRRRIVRDVCGEGHGLMLSTTYPFKIFLASGLIKAAVLFTTAGLLVALSFAGAATIAVVAFLALTFVLTLLDTLIRADAVGLLGTDLIRVAGLLGILMSFEAMVATSFGAIVVAGFLNVAGPSDAVVMLGAAVLAIMFLSVLHSYLLLVRFSAIAIMRKNVVEV